MIKWGQIWCSWWPSFAKQIAHERQRIEPTDVTARRRKKRWGKPNEAMIELLLYINHTPPQLPNRPHPQARKLETQTCGSAPVSSATRLSATTRCWIRGYWCLQHHTMATSSTPPTPAAAADAEEAAAFTSSTVCFKVRLGDWALTFGIAFQSRDENPHSARAGASSTPRSASGRGCPLSSALKQRLAAASRCSQVSYWSD